MATRPKCPTCDEPAHRLYAQVQNPETHRSTSVLMPAVFCGTPGFSDGRGTLTKGPKQHGLVVLTPAAFATQRRNSLAAVGRIPKASRKGGKPSKETKARRAKGSKSKARKPKAASPVETE